jgi:hypothetical protein
MTRFKVLVAVGLTLGGCGGGQLTDSGANKNQQMRAFLTGFTVADATRCSVTANAAAIRADLLAYEQAQGAAGAILASSGEIYDRSLNSAAQLLQSSREHCTAEKIAVLTKEMARFATKDFSLKMDDKTTAAAKPKGS